MLQRMANLESRTLGYPQSMAPKFMASDVGRDDESIITTGAGKERILGS